ncbi:MAG TPA: hypothetical protein VLU47_04515 [Blastocatellia bacterium]|nr:hypothetical protein [Blastocatellia bacterium]
MTSNGAVLVDNGNRQVAAKRSGLPSSAIGARKLKKQTSTRPEGTRPSVPERESGDQVNGFLLCTLVSESAKRIKASAERAGESLPMTMVVRAVLRSYRLAAKDKYGPLSNPELDIEGIALLNEKVLKDEIARHSRDRVKTSEMRLAHAEGLGDDSRIKAEKDGLEQAIEVRDRLGRESRMAVRT